MFTVDIDVNPTFQQVINACNKIEKKAFSLKDMGDDIKKVVTSSLDERFATEGYGMWKALSPTYRAWKLRHYPGRPILQLTQTLYGTAIGKRKEGHIDIRKEDRLEFGVDAEKVPQARRVQTKKPYRIWCMIDERDGIKIGKSAMNHIRKKIADIMGRECPSCGRPM